MKILLTGEPRSGKSTLMEEFIDSVQTSRQGFLTRELKRNGERVGFELTASSGETSILASIDSKSDIRVSKYGVEVDSLDAFLNELAEFQAHDLLYVDEIGQMQLHSKTFKHLINKYLDAPNLYIGTISKVFNDTFIESTLNRDDIVLLDLDADLDGEIRNVLKGLSVNYSALESLPAEMREKVNRMAITYAKDWRLIQLGKLFNNTLKYLSENRLEQVRENKFLVSGNTDKHSVTYDDNRFSCNCDLFNGRGNFVDKPGECSHIQSIRLKFFN